MSKNPNRSQWMLVVCVTIGLAAAVSNAAQSKDKKGLDLAAEAKQAEEELAKEAADRAKGIKPNYQRIFLGSFFALPEASDKLSPEVVGSFNTTPGDEKPGRTYQVKAENGNQAIIDSLKRLQGKKVQIAGKLRNFDENGEGKYLIVTSVLEAGGTPHVTERRKSGGI